ncbi:MAG: hypothetical protein LBJ02_10235 [Bifidobacteriaceae bacterium]|jgi:hypothetical protein|nr:hypothetical protein [Bifidobacteriaceae bacterium]
MASWKQIRKHVESKYSATVASETLLSLIVSFPGGDIQLAFVGLEGNDDSGEWVEISSPIGRLTPKQLAQAVIAVNSRICGALRGLDDGNVLLSHSFPAAVFSPKDFDWALRAITATARSMASDNPS